MIPNCKKNIYNNLELKLPSTIKNIFTPEKGSNYSAFGGSFYYKVGTRVHVHLGISGLTANSRVKLGNIPAGYRPSAPIATYGGGADGAVPNRTFVEFLTTGNYAGDIYIKPDSTYCNVDLEYDVFE